MGIGSPALLSRFGVCALLVAVVAAALIGAPSAFADGGVGVPVVSVPAAPTVETVVAAVATAVPSAPASPAPAAALPQVHQVVQLPAPAPPAASPATPLISAPRPATSATPPAARSQAIRLRPVPVPHPKLVRHAPPAPSGATLPAKQPRRALDRAAGFEPQLPAAPERSPGLGAAGGSSGVVLLLLAVAAAAFTLARPWLGGRTVPRLGIPRSLALTLDLERPD
jgi:hypothetical protein